MYAILIVVKCYEIEGDSITLRQVLDVTPIILLFVHVIDFSLHTGTDIPSIHITPYTMSEAGSEEDKMEEFAEAMTGAVCKCFQKFEIGRRTSY